MFIASNSIWVYLWHIPFLKLLYADFIIKYAVVFMLATLSAFIQVWLVKNILVKNVPHEQSKKNIKILLTG